MVVFAGILLVAGFTLAFVGRLVALLSMMAAVVAAIAVGSLLGAYGVPTGGSAAVAAIVGIVTLQAGYGFGIVTRGLTGRTEGATRPAALHGPSQQSRT